MSIKSEIKKEGIEVIRALDSSTINAIASNIVEVFQNTFPEKNLNSPKTFSDIIKLRMYIAKLPADCSAKYFYKNKSIYFSPDTSFNEISDLIIHECIHYLQERVNNSGKLVRLGFCDFTNNSLPGTGLNEAAVQLLASKCVNKKTETVTYFDLTFNTISPDYYPLECALVNQLAYLVGDNILFDSTLNSNDNFKNQFISLTSEKTFYIVQHNIDLLIEMQEIITRLNSYNESHSDCINKVQRNCFKIENLKTQIKKLFLDTQNTILTSYFDNTINLLYTKESISKYRCKLYDFRTLIAVSDGYTYFNKYYIAKMSELEYRLENSMSPAPNSLVVYKESFIKTLFSRIKYLLKLLPKQSYN